MWQPREESHSAAIIAERAWARRLPCTQFAPCMSVLCRTLVWVVVAAAAVVVVAVVVVVLVVMGGCWFSDGGRVVPEYWRWWVSVAGLSGWEAVLGW